MANWNANVSDTAAYDTAAYAKPDCDAECNANGDAASNDRVSHLWQTFGGANRHSDSDSATLQAATHA